MPVYTRDRPDWIGSSGKASYRMHWANTILQWKQQAVSEQSKWKSVCQKAVRQIEAIEDSAYANTTIEHGIASEPLDLAFAYVQEQAALLSTNPPVGQVIAMEEAENNYVAGLNHLIECEKTANGYGQTRYKTIYDGEFYNLGWLKTGANLDEYGTFGQKGKISISRVHPDHMHVDPKADELNWDCMSYIIQEHEMEIGQIRVQWPITGYDISDSEESPMFTSMMDQRSEDTVLSVVPKIGQTGSAKRQALKVLECWFKPTTLKFVPQRETQEYIDERGIKQYRYMDVLLDEEGYVLGNWVPAYPKGRCLIMCQGVILEDIPNRLPHGRCPYIPVIQAPSENLFIPGDATRILKVAMKMNDRVSDIHAYSQSETQRPMHAEIGVFPNQQYWKRVPNKANKIIPINPGRQFLRPPPVEIPQFNWELLRLYQSWMDMISGSSAVMRGTISDGAQLSAEALSSLQNFASSRLALKAKNLAAAEMELTFHLMWLIRRTYDEKITVQVTMPDGTSSTIDWESDRETFESGDEQAIARLTSQESYIVTIKAGTGAPNAQAAQQAVADKLMDRKALTKEAYLDAYQYPQRQLIAKQLNEQEKQDLAAEALGKQTGMNVKRLEKLSGPGRKPKEPPPGAA